MTMHCIIIASMIFPSRLLHRLIPEAPHHSTGGNCRVCSDFMGAAAAEMAVSPMNTRKSEAKDADIDWTHGSCHTAK